ncbi:MAG: cystathionine beta-lyase [Alphaproteobacteria bacterium]|nr:cystathionine beta-lyase [Alphaproteobacteria bacterium]
MSKLTPADRAGLKSRTRLVHSGRNPAEQFGFVNAPAWRGSTVIAPTVAELRNRNARFVYGTKGTPSTEALETAWSEIAGAAGTCLAPSGLAAIALALTAAVKAGDHLLVSDSAYRPTRNFCDQYLAKMGVETTYYDPQAGVEVEKLFQKNTSAILTEAPGSQSFEMQDVPAIAAVARRHGACVIMDNTWATPLFFPPHERGVDLAIEAGTKYLSGHSDILLGLVSANAEWFPRLRATYDLFAMCPGPEDVFLALRGMRTMELRLREAEKQGLELAHWLAARPEVKTVLHPALPAHPGHAIWKRDFSGSSGLFSIILKPVAQSAVDALLDNLQLFAMGYSWGGYESLIIPFDCSDYRTATQWSPGGPALRLQVGLEDIEDLKADLARGFTAMHAAARP